jgi:hypothetical protein
MDGLKSLLIVRTKNPIIIGNQSGSLSLLQGGIYDTFRRVRSFVEDEDLLDEDPSAR